MLECVSVAHFAAVQCFVQTTNLHSANEKQLK